MVRYPAPVILVREAIPQSAYEHEPSTPPSICKNETDHTKHVEFVCKIYDEMDIDTSPKYTSSSEFEFLSSSDPSVDGLSEGGIKERTDPDLMVPIPGPEVQLDEVQKLWGTTARTTLEKLLHEAWSKKHKAWSIHKTLFKKHKGDIRLSKIAKHPVEVEPHVVPQREGARRMSPEKAERANQEVRNLLALGMIQPLDKWNCDG